MKKFSFFISLFLSANLVAQETWDIERCITYAIDNNLQMKQMQINVASSEFSKRQATLDLLPTLNAGASHGYNFGQTIDPFTNEFATERIRNNNFFLGSQVTIFNGLTKLNNMKQAEVDLSLASKNLEVTQNDIVLQVASNYLNVLLSFELVEIAENQVNISQKQVDRMQKLVDAGQVAIGNLYEIESLMATEELNLVTQRNNLALAKLGLIQILQLPPEDTDNFELVIPNFEELKAELPRLSVAEVYLNALQAMPDIEAAELGMQSSEYDLKIAKGNLMPTLSVSGSLGTGYSGNALTPIGDLVELQVPIGEVAGTGETVVTTINEPLEGYQTKAFEDQWKDNFNQSLSLSLSVPLFNGWATRNFVQQSELNYERSVVNLEQSKNSLLQEVQQAHANALAAYNKFTAADKSVESLKENFRYAEKRFEQQIINSVDYNDAKTRYLNGQSQLLQAKYEYVFTTKILDFYQGRPIDLNF